MNNDLTEINDLRNAFKNVTFSNYQKSKAKQELMNSIYKNKIENACYWCAEFICSGNFLDLWDIIIFYMCKYIHQGNPKLALYLNMRYDSFVSIVNNGYSNNIIILRNNLKIRKLFGEIICILCYSNKKHTYQTIKLNKNEEFDLINISNKFKAPNTNYLNDIFKENDPKELFIPINELIFNITEKNIIDSCYWFEWILEYENICKKKKKICVCERRTYPPKLYNNDIIWIIWDIIFHFSNDMKKIYKIINSLYSLFIIKYNPACKRKRKLIIYFAFSLIMDDTNLDISICNCNDKVEAIVSKIDNIYKDIKKNEVSPKTDYLFKDVKKTNLEKTIEKIEIINNL